MDARDEDRGRIDRVIAGRYRLLRLLGAGGMGAVYEAENTWTRRRVAVKLLRTAAAPDATAVSRFVLEARAAAALRHPHVVDVFDLGSEEDGTLFIVQELLEGDTLRARLSARGRLSPAEAADVLAPVLDALEAAHARGVVHRDVKPENVFLARGPGGAVTPKLIDFGIAKAFGEDAAPAAHRTRTGSLVGTPAYMSPEQARGDSSVDARTDVWSAGVVLYEALAGRVPFDGATCGLTIAQVITAEVPRIEGLAPGLPRGLADVVHRALAREPGARFQSAAAFREALRGCLAEAGALDVAATGAPGARLPAPSTRLRWGAAVGAASLAALALGAWQRRGRATPSPLAPRCPGDMALVAAGTFTMGSPEGEGDPDERPQHRVRLRAFCLDRTEVSVGAYRDCVAAGRCAAPDPFRDARDDWDVFCNWARPGADDHPVNCVDWAQARAFCAWPGRDGGARRLPREAEWEYAARGVAGRAYPWGTRDLDGTRANLCGDECAGGARAFGLALASIGGWRDAHAATAPVTALPAGAAPGGVLNLAGNVWEWVEDAYEPDAYARHDAEGNPGRAPPDAARASARRVIRGGGWNDGVARWSRPTFRLGVDPTYRNLAVGFRCAREAR